MKVQYDKQADILYLELDTQKPEGVNMDNLPTYTLDIDRSLLVKAG